MGRYSFPTVIVQPTKPKVANLNQGTAIQDTWYTVVDVTGVGILSKVVLTATENNYRYSIKITIDGVANTITDATGALGLESLGLDHRSDTASNSYNPEHSIDYVCQTYFKTSLKIEIANTASADGFRASAMYSLE